MGHWGVKSYENDEASDALDAGFDRVHGERYEELMDDRNPLTYEQVQERLADERTVAASIEAIREWAGADASPEDWDDEWRLALVGVLVRHVELKVPIPDDWRRRAIAWLEDEPIEWDSATKRRLRRDQEIEGLRRAAASGGSPTGEAGMQGSA
ncbi:MAG: hypothetical protein ACYC61_33760 [Isosphaeraceae bacterium]